ncbi:MAG: hypothetical protein Fur0012_05410 [Elusimicrobiota bacterium]
MNIRKVILSALAFSVFSVSSVYAQTKFFTDNSGKGLTLSDSGGNQQLLSSKAKIVKSKGWGDNFFLCRMG